MDELRSLEIESHAQRILTLLQEQNGISRIFNKSTDALSVQWEFLNAVTKAFGVKIELTDLNNVTFTDGKLHLIEKKDDEYEFVISVRKDCSSERKILVAAHELAHFFLHIDHEDLSFFMENVGGVYREGDCREEYEAHGWAAAFLMPSVEFREVASRYYHDGSYKIVEIAKHFGVTVHQARKRGISLGLFAGIY